MLSGPVTLARQRACAEPELRSNTHVRHANNPAGSTGLKAAIESFTERDKRFEELLAEREEAEKRFRERLSDLEGE